MPKYEAGRTFFCRETGKKYERDEITDDLPEEVAKAYNDSDPGTLKPLRRTTQASPAAVRSEDGVPEPQRAVPKKRRRARA